MGRRHEWTVIVTDGAGRVLETSEPVYRAQDMWEKKRDLREKYRGSVKFRVIHQELLRIFLHGIPLYSSK